jgi:hypothetical protein
MDAHCSELMSDEVLDRAYAWLCRARRDYRSSADIWDFRRNWEKERQRLKNDLAAGQYRFGLLKRITKPDDSEIELWTARDALVLKALSIVLRPMLPVSPRCTHVKGHGGARPVASCAVPRTSRQYQLVMTGVIRGSVENDCEGQRVVCVGVHDVGPKEIDSGGSTR